VHLQALNFAAQSIAYDCFVMLYQVQAQVLQGANPYPIKSWQKQESSWLMFH
jgi:hypothetical protein